MHYTLQGENEIALSGRFTFADHSQFRQIVNRIESGTMDRCVLDLKGLEFIDSAGLGMLLLARDSASHSGAALVLRGAQAQVRRMIEVAKFDLLFVVED